MPHWIFDLKKVDGHCHVLDPARFPYPETVGYRPQGQEVGGAAYFGHVMAAYGVEHALLVGPNSGYGIDNRCMLDAILNGGNKFKGVAVVPNNADEDVLIGLRAKGVVGIAFNAALHGLEYYADIDPLLGRLRDLGMWAQFQVQGDQLASLLTRIERVGVKTLIDHCGRPLLKDGLHAPGVKALLGLGKSGLGVVKLSGFAKFSEQGYPFDDSRRHFETVLETFGTERCIWASDWPYLRAEYRLDYGTMLTQIAAWLNREQCQAIMWDTPLKLFGWDKA